MTTPHSLSRSIQIALAQQAARAPAPPPTPTAEQLADDARDALGCIETVMETISAVVHPVDTERAFLGLQLLRASCDHGRAMMFLLSSNPLDLMGSALALHRSQIETFLRAVFYAEIATDEELKDFFDNDEGPRRLTPKGKWKTIGVRDLAVEVEERISRIEGQGKNSGKIAKMVANAWSPLSGMVHGGRAIHLLYQDGQREIGCFAAAPVHYEMAVSAVVMVNFSLTLACTIGAMGGQEENEALGPPLRRFYDFVARHNARLREVGLPDMQRHIGD